METRKRVRGVIASFYIEPDKYELLREAALRRRTSVSEVVRRLVLEFLEREFGQQAGGGERGQ
jgi:hypothetical protein